MTTVTQAILEQFSNQTQLYIKTSNTEGKGDDGWRDTDTLWFMRKVKLQQEIRFCEYWIPRAEKRLDTQLGWVTHWLRARNGDEISENNYQASKAQANAEKYTVLFLKQQLVEAQEAYREGFEEEGYTSNPAYEPSDAKPKVEVSDEERAELKALGIDV